MLADLLSSIFTSISTYSNISMDRHPYSVDAAPVNGPPNVEITVA